MYERGMLSMVQIRTFAEFNISIELRWYVSMRANWVVPLRFNYSSGVERTVQMNAG